MLTDGAAHLRDWSGSGLRVRGEALSESQCKWPSKIESELTMPAMPDFDTDGTINAIALQATGSFTAHRRSSFCVVSSLSSEMNQGVLNVNCDINRIEQNAFIVSRKKYLFSLRTLGEGWSSGRSDAISNKAIDNGVSFLDHIRMVIDDGTLTEFPQVLMGPTPAGGVSFEFNKQGNSVVITFTGPGKSIGELESIFQGSYEDHGDVNDLEELKTIAIELIADL